MGIRISRPIVAVFAVGAALAVFAPLFAPALMQGVSERTFTFGVDGRISSNPVAARQKLVQEFTRQGYTCGRAIESDTSGNVLDVISCRNNRQGDLTKSHSLTLPMGINGLNRDRVVLRLSALLSEDNLRNQYNRAVAVTLQ
jgi:hypothetical protein